MARYFRYFEYAYLFFAALFVYETYRTWNIEPDRAYLSLFLSFVAVGMYFFKRYFRKKLEQRKKQ